MYCIHIISHDLLVTLKVKLWVQDVVTLVHYISMFSFTIIGPFVCTWKNLWSFGHNELERDYKINYDVATCKEEIM